jgi:hypothetical protein
VVCGSNVFKKAIMGFQGDARAMPDNDKPQHHEYKDEQAFWNVYRESRRSRGIDVDQLYAEWAAEERQKLASPGAREDFEELCQHGCNPQVLALIVAVLRNSPRLEAMWAIVVGPPENREKAARALENAAAVLEEIFGAFTAVEDEKDRAELDKIGRIPPSRMVSELRLYGRLINRAKTLAKDTESHSLGEVSKFILSSYVERTTGRPHDRNVSGLIGEITNSPDFNEVAYRMWRNRNYDRLGKHFVWITNLLVAMSAVIARPA